MFFLAGSGRNFQSILLEKLADCIPTSVPPISITTNGFDVMSMYQYDGILYVCYMNPTGRVADAYREVDLLRSIHAKTAHRIRRLARRSTTPAACVPADGVSRVPCNGTRYCVSLSQSLSSAVRVRWWRKRTMS